MALTPPESDLDFIVSQFVQDVFPPCAFSPPDAAAMEMTLEDTGAGNQTLSSILQESDRTGENGGRKFRLGQSIEVQCQVLIRPRKYFDSAAAGITAMGFWCVESGYSMPIGSRADLGCQWRRQQPCQSSYAASL